MKVLITGASGMLGSKIADFLVDKNLYEVTGTGRSLLNTSYHYIQSDITNVDELTCLLEIAKPDVIVHCAAIVNLNKCEVDKAEAYKVHVDTTKNLAAYNNGKCRLIYISTDSVFDGMNGNYPEDHITHPLNYYAASKLEGEQAALKANRNSLVLRTNIYGFNQHKNGSSLFEWIYKSLKNHQAISGFTDTIFNPLYTGQLAELISILIDKNSTGIIHCGCSEKISKFQFALITAELFGFDASLIKEDTSDSMPSILKRPKNTTLDVSKLQNIIQKNYSIQDGMKQLKADYTQKNFHE